jgi:hypothetical protein
VIEVTVQYFDDCPNWRTTDRHIQALIDEGLDLKVHHQLIDSLEAAVRYGFRGSPTVLIGGVDPFADRDAPVGLACRIYPTETGPVGSPSRRQLREAITRTRATG